MEEKFPIIRRLFNEMGISVAPHSSVVSPNAIVLHYNYVQYASFKQIENALKGISTYLHKDLQLKKSNVAHFAVLIPMKNKCVPFTLEQAENIFSKPYAIFAGVSDMNQLLGFSLTKVPHILVAGGTGSGKSVMINSIICSVLKSCPDKTKLSLVMIDTKKVELSRYKKLKQCCEMVTDVGDAFIALQAISKRIDDLYDLMLKNEWQTLPLEYGKTIVVIEELGDLMFRSRAEVEPYIVKIARLGRACGVHLVVATQRPVVSVLTGEIKANIGCRFAMKTESIRDSMNILDHKGAEKLMGEGDCLLKLPMRADEVHIQCPLIKKEDIEQVIKEFNERSK